MKDRFRVLQAVVAMRKQVTAWCLVTVVMGTVPAAGQDPAPQWSVERSPGGNTRIEIPATGGWINPRDAWEALCTAARLDPQALPARINGPEVPVDPLGARLALDVWNLMAGDVLRLQLAPDADGTPESLHVNFNRAALEQRSNQLTGLIRQSAAQVVGPGSLASEYGLRWEVPVRAAPPDQPLVILLHGYNSGPGSCRPLADHLGHAGFVCGISSYPNDGPLRSAADCLAVELFALSEEFPDREVCLIAHSMGGVVARGALERDVAPRNVTRLILVAPPNQGSPLARLPGGLDPWEHVWIRHVGRPRLLLADALGDGLNEARWDLRPNSPFLAELNSRPRNPDVEYSILLGSAGPQRQDELALVVRSWQDLAEVSRTAGFISPRMERFLTESRSLCAGSGDGVVSIEQGQLDGVGDIVVLPFSHHSFRDAESSPARDELWNAIEARLPAAP